MKKREIRRIMKRQIESHIPKSAPKIDFPFAEAKDEVVLQRKPKPFLRYALGTAMAVMVIVLAFSLFSAPVVDPPGPGVLLKNDNEVISFSAVSSVSILSGFSTNELLQGQNVLLSAEEKPAIEYVKPYLKAVDQLLSSDLDVSTGVSEYDQYDAYISFETRNLLGNPTTYVMHFNLSQKTDESEEYELEGILITGSRTYDVEGKKEVDEGEEKIAFKAYDGNRRVESVYEIENDEQT